MGRLRGPLLLLAAFCACLLTAQTPTEGDAVLRDFRFPSGEALAELRIHYRTYGTPGAMRRGWCANAVLITHGTTGSGAQFTGPAFAGQLFGAGQPLDATKYFIVLPDGIGHGKSSKPSDGLHARFPRYGYRDMVEAQRAPADGRPGRDPPAPGHGHLHGRHAHLAVGPAPPGHDGRPHAPGQPAHPDRRPEPRLAAHGHRRHPPRSAVAGR